MHVLILVEKSVKILGFKVNEIITHMLICCAGRHVRGVTLGLQLTTFRCSFVLGFLSHKVAHLSFHLEVIWVLGVQYIRRNHMNLPRWSELFSRKPGSKDWNFWAAKWAEFVDLFTSQLANIIGSLCKNLEDKWWDLILKMKLTAMALILVDQALEQADFLAQFCSWFWANLLWLLDEFWS